jgi:Inorganic Pyrophosphatase
MANPWDFVEEKPAPGADQQSPTWADYGRVAVSSAQALDAQMSAGARYVHELIGAKDLAALDKTQEQISNIGKEQTLSGLSDEAHKRLESSITSGDFWSHPFSAGALKTTGMSAQLLASALPGGVVGGALRATVAAGAAGGAVNAAQFVDDIYAKTDALSDKDLQKQSELYRGLRTMFDEPQAREQYNHQIMGAKPAINFAIGAIANAVGPAGMLARGGEGAVLGAAEQGTAKRMGMGALEAGGTGGLQGGVANYTEQHAEMEGGLAKDFDRNALVNAILEPTVIAGALGGVAGIRSHEAKGRGTKGEVTPEVTPKEPTSTPADTGPAPSVGRTGSASPPNETIPVGNEQSAPTRSETKYPKVGEKGEAAKAVAKGKKNKPPPATEPIAETIAPDQAAAIAAHNPDPEVITDRQTAAEVAQPHVPPVQPDIQQPGPPVQPVRQEAPPIAAEPAQRVEPVKAPEVLQPQEVAQAAPVEAPQPRAVEPAAPAKPRILEDLTPRAQEIVAKAKADQAAALKEAAAAEKPVEPGEKHRTKAEKEKLVSDADKAKAIFESSPTGEFPRTAGERAALLTRLTAALKRAEAEGIKIPTKVSDSTPDHVVWLREAKDLQTKLAKKSYVGDLANEHINTFLGNEAIAKGGDFSVMREGRKAEGAAAGNRYGGKAETAKASETAKSETKAASVVRKVKLTAEERAKYEKPEPKVTPKVTEKVAALKEKAAAKAPAKEPTPAQKEAGNYKKTHLSVDGLDIAIENVKGSTRKGVGPDGKPWEVVMPDHYGYIKRTEGADGDHVDITYNGKGEHVFVIDQIDPNTGKFDEHKVMYGYKDGPAAMEAYEKSFSDGRGFERIGNIVSMSKDKFKEWLKEGNTKKEASDQHELPIPEDVRAKEGGGPRIEKAPGGAYFRPVHTTTAREALSSNVLPKGVVSRAIYTAVSARLKSLIGDTKIHIVSPEDMARMDGRSVSSSAEGLWSRKTRAVYIRKDVFEDKQKYSHVVLHELLHEAVNDALEKSTHAAEQVKRMMAEVNEYIKGADDDAVRVAHYALTDEHEFISEALSNPEFQKLLSRIDMPADLVASMKMGERRTMWDGLVAAIRKWLGMPDGAHTLLEGALAQGDWLISQGRVEPRGDWKPGTRAYRTPTREEVTSRVRDTGIDVAGKLRRGMDKLSSMRQLGYQSARAGEQFHGNAKSLIDAVSRMNQEATKILGEHGGEKIVRDIAEFERNHGSQALADMAEVGFEASNLNVNLGKNADNTHLGKDVANNVQAKHRLPDLQKQFDALHPEAQALLQKVGKYFRDMQNELSLQHIKNVLEHAGVDEPGLAERIHRDGLTDADREKFATDTPVRALNRIREFKRLEGLYLPFRRYGDFVVNGRHEIAVPGSATRLDDGRIVFTDPNNKGGDAAARASALAWARVNDLTHTDTNKIFVDKADHTKILPKDDVNAVPAYAIRLQDQHTEFHTSESAALNRAEELRAAGLKDVSTSKRRELHAKSPGMMAGDIAMVMHALERQDRFKDAPDTVKNAMHQALNEASIIARGATKIQGRFLQRRNVSGFSQDISKVTAEYAKTSARYLAKLRWQSKIDAAMAAMDKTIEDLKHQNNGQHQRREELYQAFDKALHDVPSQEAPGTFSKIANRLLQVSRLDKLAGVSFHVINAQEPWTTALPVIGGRHGFASAARAMSEAYNAIGAHGAVMNSLRDTAKAWSQDFGFTDYIKDMKDNLAKSPSLGGDKARRYSEMLDYIKDRGLLSHNAIYEVGRHVDPSSNVIGRGLDRADLMANQVGTAIETINRAVTALSAYELEYRRTGNHEASMHYALETTDKTMGDYSSWNAAHAFKTPVGALALQFKKFAQKTYYLLGSTFRGAIAGDREAAKQFAGLMVTHAIVAGAMGLPLEPFKVALMAANMFGLTGFTWQDFEQVIREKTAAVLGKTGGEIFSRGLPRAIGIESGARQGLDSLLTFGAPRSNKPNDLKAWLFDTAAGAPAGLLLDQVKMSQALMKGDFAQAAELAVPIKAASDIIKAARGTTPTTNDRGQETQRAMTPYEMGVRAIGFTPSAVAEQGERRAQAGRMSAQQRQERQDFESKWAAAKPYDRMLLWGRIEQWNRDRPREAQLTRSQLDNYVRSQAKTNAAAVGGIRSTKQTKDILNRVSVYNN